MEKWIKLNEHQSYDVSDKGRVRNNKNGNILKTWDNGNGYLFVSLGRNNKHRVHRLVAAGFIENNEKKDFINHINCDKSDNRVENLEWCTRSENMKHAYDNGLMNNNPKKGKEHPASVSVIAKDMFGTTVLNFDTCTAAANFVNGCNSLISCASRNKAGRNRNSRKAYGYYWYRE